MNTVFKFDFKKINQIKLINTELMYQKSSIKSHGSHV